MATSAVSDLHGRVSIVTGGSRGIGRDVCLALARHGASVVVCYQGNSSAAAEVVDLIQKEGNGAAIAVKCDVSNTSDVTALFDQAISTFGQVNIVVHLAGILLSSYPTIEDTSLEDWQQTFSVNVTGTFLVCKEAAARITQGGKGRIVTTSSSMVHILKPGYGAYVASKAAVETLTKILAKELRGRRITANCVAPGPVATEMFFAGKDEATIQAMREAPPLQRLGEPADITSLILFLVSDGGEWVNGQVIRANGGFAI
ncbi:hypothetical protein KP509_13G070400 [Ceratopteris richardii]|uniref:Uncharacterized protein n=1 Tax=Ceratopteris richardii TaxID=49495 RepID=A0A8T2TJW9_CERRI|nr:hypothetical protein KP509_13G070400 [Ceratopteris richardii]